MKPQSKENPLHYYLTIAFFFLPKLIQDAFYPIFPRGRARIYAIRIAVDTIKPSNKEHNFKLNSGILSQTKHSIWCHLTEITSSRHHSHETYKLQTTLFYYKYGL